MKHILQFFRRLDLTFWLLIAAAVMLFCGGILTRYFNTDMKQLNDLLFQTWLMQHTAQPHLYVWIIALFGILTLLAGNTLVCSAYSVMQALKTGFTTKKLGYLIFHGCFIVFLFGHMLSTFWGTNQAFILQTGESKTMQAAGVTLHLVSSRQDMLTDNNQQILLSTQAILDVSSDRGRKTLNIGAFKPGFTHGLSLHVGLKDKGLKKGAVQIIVRRDYGLPILLAGAMLTLIAAGFFTASLLARRPAIKIPQGGKP